MSGYDSHEFHPSSYTGGVPGKEHPTSPPSPQSPTHDAAREPQPASVLRTAPKVETDDDRYNNKTHPRVRGKCPSCGWNTLFLGSHGYVTCSLIGCKNPGAAHDMLELSHHADARTAELQTRVLTLKSLLDMVIERSHRDTESLQLQLREAMQ